MKYFVTFVFFLTTLVSFSYAQETISCEAEFGLTSGKQCSPCQQTLHKYNLGGSSSSSTSLSLPSDKCLVFNVFGFYLNGVSPTDKNAVDQALDKTCNDLKQCTEPYAKSAYTEIDKSCSAEITAASSGNITSGAGATGGSDAIAGTIASITVLEYYLAIPLKGFICSNEGKGCINNFIDTKGMSGSGSGFTPQCDDCTKRYLGRLLRFKETHPLDTPAGALQLLFNSIDEFQKTCPIPKEYMVDSKGCKEISNLGITLAGIIGAASLTLM